MLINGDRDLTKNIGIPIIYFITYMLYTSHRHYLLIEEHVMLDQIKVLGVHYHVSETTLEFIGEKLDKLSYLKDRIVDGTLRIIHEKNSFKVEIDIHFNHGKRIHLHSTRDQLYPAIETLIHKLRKTAADEKQKLKDYHNHHIEHHHENVYKDDSTS